MKYLLRSLNDQTEIAEAETCEQAIDMLVDADDIDLVLLDLNLPGKKHLAALDAVKLVRDDIPIVVLSGDESPSLVRSSIDKGAMGFIPKSSSHEILIHAMRLVLAGGVYLPAIAMDRKQELRVDAPYVDVFKVLSELLSERQIEVLRLVVEGKSNRAIADVLHISENTVKTHVSAVMRALNTKSRTETVYYTARLAMESRP